MAAETNSPVDGMEYFTVFFFTVVDSGEQQRETRVIQHRSMNGEFLKALVLATRSSCEEKIHTAQCDLCTSDTTDLV